MSEIKKASFNVEVEYTSDNNGIGDMYIKNIEQEGDYESLTVAMTHAIMGGIKRDNYGDLDFLKDKTRMTRAILSGLVSAITSLRVASPRMTETFDDEDIASIIKMLMSVGDLISIGMIDVLELSPSTINDINDEYEYSEPNNDNNEGKGTKPTSDYDFL